MSFAKRSSSYLKEARSYRVTSEVTSDVVADFLHALDCPRALTVYLLFISGEHEQLANLEFDPLDYLTAVDLGDAYAATKFLSKFKGLTLNYDLDAVALQKFEKFEFLCKQTNSRFRNPVVDPLYTGPIVWLHNEVKRKVAWILGDYSVEEIFASANWGPGATTLIKSVDASSANKFQREVGITRDLYALIPDSCIAGAYPSWYRHLLESGYPCFQVGNKVVTVPKDATANRVIAIEPGINLWFQKAIGSMIQKRLLRVGVDLSRQSINQNMAYTASKDLVHATIDFSSASDSISYEVVKELLPPRWFHLLDSARSRFGQQGESLIEWEKFSSMGNGFTFQLESLLFYAIARCVVEYLHESSLSASENFVSVYGDDVIIPVKCLDLFSAASSYFGFSMNLKKSQFSSCFRESCGAHFVSGVDVKPVYLKDSLSDVTSVFRLANAVRRFAHRRMNKFACDARFRSVFASLVSLVPKRLCFFIPETLGDGGIIENFDIALPVRCKSNPKTLWVEGFFVNNVMSVSKTYQSDRIGVLFSRLWVPSTQEERNTVPLRGRTRLRLTRSFVSQWYDLGPWI
jgi:hypothetical protein